MWQSGYWQVAFPITLLIFLGLLKPQTQFVKIWGWILVPLFSLWFIVTPAGFVWIYLVLFWFFLFLATLQWSGGQSRFVLVNTALAIGFSASWNAGVCYALFIAWLWGILLPFKMPWRQWGLWIYLVAIVMLIGFLGWSLQHLPQYNGYWSMQRVGFSNTSILGSFGDAYLWNNQDQVVLRLHSDLPILYLQGMEYRKYGGGVWREIGAKWITPQQRNGEYALYNLASNSKVPQAWMEVLRETGGAILVDRGTQNFAVDADSLRVQGGYFPEGDFTKRGYYLDQGHQDLRQADSLDLLLPPTLKNWLDSLARSWKLSREPTQLHQQLSSIFTHQFQYSLRVPMQSGKDPLRSFVEHRQGYCEYFATLGTLLLRHQGVPARYVTGFAGPVGQPGTWVYREQDAHAWVEAQFDAKKFSLWDPTPSNFRPQTPPSSIRFWWYQMWSYWGKIKHLILDGQWRMHLDQWSNSIRQNMYWGLGIIPIVSLVWFFRRRKAQKILTASGKSWHLKLTRAEKILAQQGYTRPVSLPVGQWLAQLPADASSLAKDILQDYQEHRFK